MVPGESRGGEEGTRRGGSHELNIRRIEDY